ncbi:hypothetical protein ACFWHT_06490 [Microbacterium sp. NPDC058342]|uniref:hypothetical protein n=1 Tax=Microbacterium sp. NPDC058342 TaxID=3346454 RepID=UPI00365D541C
MAKSDDRAVEAEASTSDARGWVPTADAKRQATRLRWIAAVLWAIAIAGEAVAIFWVLRQRDVPADTGLTRNPETGLLEQQATGGTFPQWAFITLLVMLVVIAALSITGSLLWKSANRLDPARKSDTVRFFVQNQLGAIIAVIAFLPLIILIFLNKDMDKGQKTTAGAIGIVLAAVAVFFGISFTPPSVEKYTADQSTVIMMLGEDQVTWVAGGGVYHVCDRVSDIQTGSEIMTGTTAEAIEAGKQRLTLKFASELRACDLPVPVNVQEITDALRQIQDDRTVTLPKPEWGEGVTPPLVVDDAAPAAG